MHRRAPPQSTHSFVPANVLSGHEKHPLSPKPPLGSVLVHVTSHAAPIATVSSQTAEWVSLCLTRSVVCEGARNDPCTLLSRQTKHGTPRPTRYESCPRGANDKPREVPKDDRRPRAPHRRRLRTVQDKRRAALQRPCPVVTVPSPITMVSHFKNKCTLFLAYGRRGKSTRKMTRGGALLCCRPIQKYWCVLFENSPTQTDPLDSPSFQRRRQLDKDQGLKQLTFSSLSQQRGKLNKKFKSIMARQLVLSAVVLTDGRWESARFK